MTDLELGELAQSIASEQAVRKTKSTVSIAVSVEFGAYNEKYWGKPWICQVTSWNVGGDYEINFGKYNGDSDGGVAEIIASPGSIIRWGQKYLYDKTETRIWKRKSESSWGMVNEDGTITKITQAKARRAFLGQ
jgi:hypothetical protein